MNKLLLLFIITLNSNRSITPIQILYLKSFFLDQVKVSTKYQVVLSRFKIISYTITQVLVVFCLDFSKL